MTQREFAFDDGKESAEPAVMDIEKMTRKDASEVMWHGDAAALLAFATAMGIRREIDAAMDAYNRSTAEDPMIVAFANAEEFVVDQGVRAAIAATYNAKRNGRSPSYGDALAMNPMRPRKPKMRTISEALRFLQARKMADALSRTT